MKTETRTEARSALTWRNLSGGSGIALFTLLALAAVALRDFEAAAIGIGVIISFALLRFRTGLLGLLGLALVAANVAFWMTPGAISNLTHGEAFFDSALPSALAIVALTTLVSSVLAIAGRRSEVAGQRAARPFAAVAAVVLAAALVVAGTGVGNATQIEPGDIKLVAEQVKFSSKALRADAGTVGVYLANKDLFWHTFTIKKLDVNLNVPVKAERRVEFVAQAGRYEFICMIPGHAQAGMKGTLTVR